jgi:hypothetical protein
MFSRTSNSLVVIQTGQKHEQMLFFLDVLRVELSAWKFKLAQNQMIEKFPQVEWNVLQKFLVIHSKLWESLHHLFPLWLYLDS